MVTRLQQLTEAGQSPWLDNIRRDFIKSGGLRELVESGIRGVTANPTIFAKAISAGTDYDDAIRQLSHTGASIGEIRESLMVEDVRMAADVLQPLYEQTDGSDGYVSIEVSPALAHDTEGTIKEAKRLWSRINRPNAFVKVPATDQGVPAIQQLLGEGININITLIFSIDYYEQVMDAYLAAMEKLAEDDEPLEKTASVASFFVSRVDTEVDKRLDRLIEAEQDESRRKELESLKGKAAISNAKLAYERFREKFSGQRFKMLEAKGARVQRPLWASTSTKDPAYRDVMYVEELIGPDTVNTMPPGTIEAFEDHGKVERTIDQGVEESHQTIEMLEAFGISMKDVTDKLQSEGVRKFADSFEELDKMIRGKCEALVTDVPDTSVVNRYANA